MDNSEKENEEHFFEPLFERAQNYLETTLDLYKLKAIEQISGVFSTFIIRAVILMVLILFVLMLSIGMAIWLGEIFGKMYYGFMCIAGFYAIVSLIFYFLLQKKAKESIQNSIISQMLNL
ncbi:MAG: hypothetical protein IPH93_12365 [Saprospiraceae bacterium]|nr:hypothetical protein [Saprospiraceae bacterium]MBK7812739.1 hypothetical protein [Saprospiraceae bacterium]MBK9630930.1 hypothetical protein [Saprospiraceae bacterium]